jgi:hypothetical protein
MKENRAKGQKSGPTESAFFFKELSSIFDKDSQMASLNIGETER